MVCGGAGVPLTHGVWCCWCAMAILHRGHVDRDAGAHRAKSSEGELFIPAEFLPAADGENSHADNAQDFDNVQDFNNVQDFTSGPRAVALHEFLSTLSVELSTTKGQSLALRQSINPDWVLCTNVDGDSGIVPWSHLLVVKHLPLTSTNAIR